MSEKPFYKTEKDLPDDKQDTLQPETDFTAQNPDGAAKSIESAAQIEFSQDIEDELMEQARVIQNTNNDPDIPDRYEDDVYTSVERAFRAQKASALRGYGAGADSRGVESPTRWAYARTEDFSKTVKSGEPDDAEFTSDNDLLPMGHPLRSIEDPPEGVDDQPFVEGEPDSETKDDLQPVFEMKL